MGETRPWPALVIRQHTVEGWPLASPDELLAAILDDFSPAAIEELNELPFPLGGLWDPAVPARPEPPLAPLAWRVFFQSAAQRDAALDAITRALPDLELTTEDISDENWAARSQEALRAVTAGRFIVAPPWDVPTPIPDDATLIIIDPSRGFGTGHHASTRLCLRALSGIDVLGARVLDVGTGSGVLALAAAFRGAREVIAIDIDPDAIESACASAALNATPIAISFRVSDFRVDTEVAAPTQCEDEHGGHDLVLANLTGGMLMSSADRIRRLVRPGGRVITSGFDEGELREVRAALLPLDCDTLLTEEGWVGLVVRSRA